MLKNILLSLVFITGVLGRCSAQNDIQDLEQNQISHGNEHLDRIKNTILYRLHGQESRFYLNLRYVQNGFFNGILMQERFFDIKPKVNKNVLMQLVMYWMANRPWSKEDPALKQAFLNAELVNQHGVVDQEIADAIYRNLMGGTNKNITYNADGIAEYNDDVIEPNLGDSLEENQVAHAAMHRSVIENVYKETDKEFNEQKHILLAVREKPETVRKITISSALSKRYPQLTQDALSRLARYFVFNEPWSTLDLDVKYILLKAELVDQEDGVIRDDLRADLFLAIKVRFAGFYEINDVKRKTELFDHIRQRPQDLHEIEIDPILYNRPKELGLDHTITKQEMVALFGIFIAPNLWRLLSVKDQESLTQTGYIDKNGTIKDHLAFLLGFDIILKDQDKNGLEIPVYKSEQLETEIIDLQGITKNDINYI